MRDDAPDFATIPPAEGYDALAAFAETVKRLAALPEHEYEFVRRTEAKNIGMRTSVLDQAVQNARPRDASDAGQGEPITVEDVEPWPDPVDGAALLDEVKAFVEDHVVLPRHAAVKVALWIAHTHCCEAAFITPRLAITSPTKQCGKTTLLDVINSLACRPVSASNLTAAATFRIIAMAKPTLLIDEADTFMQTNEELRGVVNAGHRADGSILRVVGDDHEPRRFKVFGPCAIAGIRSLPSTIADRSIHVRMARKGRAEKVKSFRADRTEVPDRLRAMLARFAVDNLTRLIGTDPELPAGAFNRFADNWRCLAAIADVAGGRWPAAARAAILADLGVKEDDELGQQLLEDVRHLFDAHYAGEHGPASCLSSAQIVLALKAMGERPWAEFGKSERPISEHKLAAMLRPFGIKSANHRFPPALPGGKEQVLKGYERGQFVEAWNRYLAPPVAVQTATPLQPREAAAHSASRTATDPPPVAARKPPKAAHDMACSGVADRNTPASGENGNGFVVTDQWQEVPPDYVAMPGVRVRFDLDVNGATRARAKLADVVTPADNGQPAQERAGADAAASVDPVAALRVLVREQLEHGWTVERLAADASKSGRRRITPDQLSAFLAGKSGSYHLHDALRAMFADA